MNEEEVNQMKALWPFGKLTAVEVNHLIESLDFFINTLPVRETSQTIDRMNELRQRMEQLLDEFYNEC